MFAYPKINPDVLNPREVYEVKLLMAYFMNHADRDCTPAQLLEIFTGDGVVDYFLYTEALKEMLDNGLIIVVETEGVKYYRLSEKGRAGAESFKKLVNKSVRDRILSSGMRLFARLKAEQSVQTEITELGGGSCELRCCIEDNGIKLMELTLFAPDKTQAEHMRSKIMSNPSDLYGRILDHVVCTDDEYSEPFDADM
ncbi:protein of unknown function [Ruminococcus sp. YE71]|uniref:DUF4364 family protein n=1 Tax=unclassified Ruminococcus TaxID=2608920 RepID=UPI0008855AE9|nr:MULTISPECIES: DUF4364 family protein [unclassified Ruminococcus]SDA14155.1 protein of unknown function [Ruminococcus sp. YE78]SFW20651.1 protein of unknown function [Ruminococcus sp. YE71]